MAKKLSVSSQHGKRKKVSGKDIYSVTPKIKRELERLAKMPDSKINLNDSEALKITDWSTAVRGKFYRPIKKLISIRIDMDVLEWFKHTNKKYQTLINQACREYMISHQKPARVKK